MRFVLVEPSHVGNIGSCCRAIRSMGFDRLVVVRPRDPAYRQAPEAVALAAGAADVLAASVTAESLAEALAGVRMAFATTGYARDFGPPVLEVRAACREAAAALRAGSERGTAPAAAGVTGAAMPASGAGATAAPAGSVCATAPPASGDVAFVFGPERTGLANEDVQRCHYCCSIPADPERASLNLSQAAQVVAYECRRALVGVAALAALPRRDLGQGQARADEVAAGVEQTEAMFDHLQRGLEAVGYLDPDQPKHLMARVRRLLLRAQPTPTEVDILRGIASAMVMPRALRAGSKKPRGE